MVGRPNGEARHGATWRALRARCWRERSDGEVQGVPSVEPRPEGAVVTTHDRELGKVKISPTIGLYTLIHKKQKLGVLSELDMEWWPRPGSNRRHTDFQSV